MRSPGVESDRRPTMPRIRRRTISANVRTTTAADATSHHRCSQPHADVAPLRGSGRFGFDGLVGGVADVDLTVKTRRKQAACAPRYWVMPSLGWSAPRHHAGSRPCWGLVADFRVQPSRMSVQPTSSIWKDSRPLPEVPSTRTLTEMPVIGWLLARLTCSRFHGISDAMCGNPYASSTSVCRPWVTVSRTSYTEPAAMVGLT